MSDETLRALERREREAPDDSAAADAADRERARAGQPTRRADLLRRLAHALDPEARFAKLRRETNEAVGRIMYAGVRARARVGRSGAVPEEQAVAIPLVSLLVSEVPTLTQDEAERIANAVLYYGTAEQRHGDIAQRVAAEAVRLARLALLDGRERGPGTQPFSDGARIAFAALARAVGVPLAYRLTGRPDPVIVSQRMLRETSDGIHPYADPSRAHPFPRFRRSPAQEHRESDDRHRDLRP